MYFYFCSFRLGLVWRDCARLCLFLVFWGRVSLWGLGFPSISTSQVLDYRCVPPGVCSGEFWLHRFCSQQITRRNLPRSYLDSRIHTHTHTHARMHTRMYSTNILIHKYNLLGHCNITCIYLSDLRALGIGLGGSFLRKVTIPYLDQALDNISPELWAPQSHTPHCLFLLNKTASNDSRVYSGQHCRSHLPDILTYWFINFGYELRLELWGHNSGLKELLNFFQ